MAVVVHSLAGARMFGCTGTTKLRFSVRVEARASDLMRKGNATQAFSQLFRIGLVAPLQPTACAAMRRKARWRRTGSESWKVAPIGPPSGPIGQPLASISRPDAVTQNISAKLAGVLGAEVVHSGGLNGHVIAYQVLHVARRPPSYGLCVRHRAPRLRKSGFQRRNGRFRCRGQ